MHTNPNYNHSTVEYNSTVQTLIVNEYKWLTSIVWTFVRSVDLVVCFCSYYPLHGYRSVNDDGIDSVSDA